MSKRTGNLLEGIGLIFILFSFFVQMIETNIETDTRELANYQIHKKLDHIWQIVSTDYAKRYPEQDVRITIDFKHFVNEYKIYSEDKEELSNWEKLVKYKWFTNIRLSLFILGSLLLIIPKFIKTKD